MAYRVQVSRDANADIDGVLSYLAVKLSNLDAAIRLADELEHVYDQLSEHPRLYEQARDPLLCRQGYRKVVIGNYVLLYLVDDDRQLVTVARLFYGRRNYPNYI